MRIKRDWPFLAIFAAGAIAIVWIALAFASGTGSGTGTTASSIQPLSIPAGEADMLEVNPLVTLDTKAPAFTLTDQNGHTTSLSSFRGKSVVLTFGDDECTDLCTLLAQDVVAADKDLGTSASKVQFVSINANTFYPQVAATKAWTDEHGLGKVANWHFLTGSIPTLTKLAATYGVDVELDHKNKTIVHGADMFFIDPTGHERQIGQFGVESANTGLFGHSVARLAADTAPHGSSVIVTGAAPKAVSSTSTTTAIGSTPPPVVLTELATGHTVSTATYRGKYVVLNFWSTTCSICTQEMPDIQKAAKSGDTKSVILGVDDSDPSALAAAFVKRTGVTYPILLDSTGTTSGQYEIPGLPYTVILNPKGQVVVRHPGAITTEQLEYLLQTLEGEGD